MLKIQTSFIGGIDQVSSDTQIPDDCVSLLINGRNRFNEIEPVKKHILIYTPAGFKNGGYAIGGVFLLFVEGKAYHQFDGETQWVKIPGFQMSTSKKYYFQAVPASSFNFERKLVSTDDVHSPMFINTSVRINGTPSGLIVQDGENQPWIIQYDENTRAFQARETKKYTDWKGTSQSYIDREYVPIGTFMFYLNAKLFIVSRDKKKIFQSVTGRPLDFVINVDSSGNKLSTENQGGADALSFAFDYDEITCVKTLNVKDAFLYATKNTLRIIQLDYENTLFGEPRYREATKIEAGVVNNESFIEVLGDYAFIDDEGVKSFNAVKQILDEGRNSYFSLNVAKLLNGVKQYRSNCTVFDNYTIFNVDSSFGNVMLIYDMLLQKWASVDITTCIYVKDFVHVKTTTASKLYAVTNTNEVYQMFKGPLTSTTYVETKAYTSENIISEHKSQYLRLFFSNSSVNGTVTVLEHVDEQESPNTRESKNLDLIISGINYPVIPPVKPNNAQRIDNPQFTFVNGLTGKKIAYTIMWNTNATLKGFEVKTDELTGDSSMKQKQQTYVSNS